MKANQLVPCAAFFAVTVASLATSASAGVDDPHPVPGETYVIDLVTALRLAGANNLDVAFFREQINEAKSEEAVSALWYLPDLTAGARYNRHDGQIQSTEGEILDVNKGSLHSPLGVEAFINPVDGIYRKLVAEQKRKVVEAIHERSVADAMEAAAIGYYRLVRVTELIGIADDAVARSEELVRLSEKLAEGGAGLQAEVARAKANLAVDQQRSLAVRRDLDLAASRLAVVLQLDPAARLRPRRGAVRIITLVNESEPLEEMYARALSQRPEMLESLALKISAQHEEKATKLQPLTPQFGVGAGYGTFGGGTGGRLNDFDDRAELMVSVQWRFQFGYAERRQAAESRHRQAELGVSQVEQAIRLEIVERRYRMQALREQVGLTIKEEVAARETLRLTRERFEQGAGLQLEVLQAQSALTESQGKHLGAIIDSNQTQHRLLRALGGTAGRRVIATGGGPP